MVKVIEMAASALRDKHIFIIEDNTENRLIFQLIFMKHEAQTGFDRWGTEAISRMRNVTHIDLIILDLMLSDGVSGFDIFWQIRGVARFADTPIVAVSAMEPAIAVPKVQKLGFDGFIAKPIDKLLFPLQIASIIQGEKVWYTG
jgi:CheY-like chemotaxis protein